VLPTPAIQPPRRPAQTSLPGFSPPPARPSTVAPPTRAKTTTLPPGITEKMDDDWDAAAGSAPTPAAPATDAAPADGEAKPADPIDSGWE